MIMGLAVCNGRGGLRIGEEVLRWNIHVYMLRRISLTQVMVDYSETLNTYRVDSINRLAQIMMC